MIPRLCSVLLFCLLTGMALAAADEEQPAVATQGLSLAPTTHLYSPYLADPKRVTFGLEALSVSENTIPDTGDSRIGLRLGGRLELFQYAWQGHRLQANLEVGYRGRFDHSNAQDEIGWDGNYGLLFSYRGSELLAYRFGIYHTSSHIGDEYIERTGRARISYTREEYLLGVQLNLDPAWQVYAEGGSAYNLKTKPLQRKKRAQMGVQYQGGGFSISPRLGWFAAADFSAYEERDWMINKSFQLGYSFAAQPHTWRLALEHYDGQVPLGEFFQHDERYSGIGLYLDL